MDAPSRRRFDRVLGHGQHDDGNDEVELAQLVDERHALDAALEQRIDEHDVWAQLLDLADGLGPVGDDVQQLDRGLRREQPADVLGDLRDVLNEKQPNLVG